MGLTNAIRKAVTFIRPRELIRHSQYNGINWQICFRQRDRCAGKLTLCRSAIYGKDVRSNCSNLRSSVTIAQGEKRATGRRRLTLTLLASFFVIFHHLRLSELCKDSTVFWAVAMDESNGEKRRRKKQLTEKEKKQLTEKEKKGMLFTK